MAAEAWAGSLRLTCLITYSVGRKKNYKMQNLTFLTNLKRFSSSKKSCKKQKLATAAAAATTTIQVPSINSVTAESLFGLQTMLETYLLNLLLFWAGGRWGKSWCGRGRSGSVLGNVLSSFLRVRVGRGRRSNLQKPINIL